jgi:DNA polymerase type B, organellar and viral
MRDYLHPVKFRSHQWGGTVRELSQAVRGYWCAASVSLRKSPLELPRRAGRNLYWDGVPGLRHLAGAELCQAVFGGYVQRVHAIARYDYGVPFTGFVDNLFALKLRLTGDNKHGQAAICKLILNSLHGKFAQKGRRWVAATGAVNGAPWTTWWGRSPANGAWCAHRNLGGIVQYCEEAGEWRDSFPAVSASIASAARVELANARNAAGVGETLYCDTDSLHLVGRAYDRLAAGHFLDPARLGGWKTVTTGSDAHYWGLKHYRVGDKYTCCYLTPSAWEVSDGRFRDAARIHFGRLLAEGLPDAVYYKERMVRVRDADSGERAELIDYGDVA